jgi:hypothetical protein
MKWFNAVLRINALQSAMDGQRQSSLALKPQVLTLKKGAFFQAG